MFAIAVSLTNGDGERGSFTDSTLVEVFRSLSTSSDGLEHLRARVGTGTMDMVLFLRAGCLPDARVAALRLCQHVLTTEPGLAGWSVQDCAPVEIPL